MAVYLAPGPFGAGYQAFDSNGDPLNAGKITTYAAGTNTSQATFTTATGNVTNANPIILSSDGRPQNSGSLIEIWLTAGISYKFDIKDSSNNQVSVYDNLAGINDIGSQSEWILGATPVFVSATQFTVPSNLTAIFNVGRRVRAVVTAGTIYGTVSAVSFSTNTTVTVDWDSTQLDAGLSTVSYSILDAANPSIPTTRMDQPVETVTAASTLDLSIVRARNVNVTGSTTITRVSIPDGQVRFLQFNNQVNLSNTVSQILLAASGVTITAVTGSVAIFRGEPGLSRMVDYSVPLTPGLTTSSLTANVSCTSTTQYFTGPQVVQGTSGTFVVFGQVTVSDGGGAATFNARLTDGVTILASVQLSTSAGNQRLVIPLSGSIANPAGNLRITVNDATSSGGFISFNDSGNSKDSTITAFRVLGG